ncbi:unnamed protein product, partial [Ixodes pacificus]
AEPPFFFNAEVLRKYYVYAIRFRGKSRSRVHALFVFTRDCSLRARRAEFPVALFHTVAGCTDQ